MSTILDALNRAERERRMGELPPIERLLEPPGLASLPPERQFPGRATIVTVVFMVSLGLVAAVVALMRTPPQGAYPGPFSSFAGVLAPEPKPASATNPAEARRGTVPEPGRASAHAAVENVQPQAAQRPEARSGEAQTWDHAAAPKREAIKDSGAGDRPVEDRPVQDRSVQHRSAQDRTTQDKPARNKSAPVRARQDTALANPPAARQTLEKSAASSRLPERTQAAPAPQRASTTPPAQVRTAKQAGTDPTLSTDKAVPDKAVPAKAIEKPLPGWHELPNSLRQQLPEIKLGGYIYSPNPAARSILINGKLLREGDQLSTGLRLEQMRPDGVVFEYKDVRFRMAY